MVKIDYYTVIDKNLVIFTQNMLNCSPILYEMIKFKDWAKFEIESKTRKNFLILKVLELFEPNRNEINRIESNSEYALNSRVSLY